MQAQNRQGFCLLGKVLKEATVRHGVKEVGERVCLPCQFFLQEKSQEQTYQQTVAQSPRTLFPVLVFSVEIVLLPPKILRVCSSKQRGKEAVATLPQVDTGILFLLNIILLKLQNGIML